MQASITSSSPDSLITAYAENPKNELNPLLIMMIVMTMMSLQVTSYIRAKKKSNFFSSNPKTQRSGQ